MSQETTPSKEKGHALLLRKGSHSKMALKEKIVQIYEAFFQGEDPSRGNPNFWEELFLLKVNTSYIENEIEKLSGEGLLNLKDNLNLLFYQCVETLSQENLIRVLNALHTLCAIIRGIFRKSLGNYGFDVINLLIGFDSAESVMQTLIDNLNRFLTGDYPTGVKQLVLKFLLVLITENAYKSPKEDVYSIDLKPLQATDNISQNTMLEYILINSVFESIILILGNPLLRVSLGHEAILVLTLLVQYRKHESANPYIVKLSILDDELALTGYAQIVSSVLVEFNRNYQIQLSEPQSGWFSAFANMVGNMFVAEEKKTEIMRANDSILLALYEAIHLNRNFITALTHAHTPSSPATPPSSPVTTTSPVLDNQAPAENVNEVTTATQPTNLLVTFLEYSSIIFQDTKDTTRYNNTKLCMVILTCIAEDQYANSLMHDMNMTFRVPLHRMENAYKSPKEDVYSIDLKPLQQMRHRKVKADRTMILRPLVCSLLDLLVEFVMSHMMKTFPMELYLRCLGIIHRVLCYQKRCRVRIQHPWKEMWTALINLLKFIMSHESQLVKKHNIFHLCSKVVNVFNLFITYGDTFLPNPNSYDELYYELVRMHQVFDNLYSMALRYTTTDSEHRESAARLTNHLVNVRAIINHFTPKVDSWAAANHLSSLTEEQVLEVVRSNYDTLTLKLQDSLDQYERYSEKPKETAFFTQLVRLIICDVRRGVSNLSTHQQDVLHELSTIS